MDKLVQNSIILKIIDWYDKNKRDLPWRSDGTTYEVWLSEVLLQQTRVDQGLPYYHNFLKRFPNLNALANATEDEVLHCWQGLGYYTRARNLLKCAKLVMSDYDGNFPESYHELIKLPGIGPYTGAAIASIVFKKGVPVVDGNVFRVLSRIFGIYADIGSSKENRAFYKLSEDLILKDRPGTYNQSMMELGALVCKPKQPLCDICPVNLHCWAYRMDKQNELPVKKRRIKIKQRYFHYLVLDYNNRFYLRKRGNKDIWRGLYDFLLLESGNEMIQWGNLCLDFPQGVVEKNLERLGGTYKHVLSHQRLVIRFYRLKIDSLNLEYLDELLKKGDFYSWEEMEGLPKPVLIDRFMKEFDKSLAY